MSIDYSFLIILFAGTHAWGEVFVYEGDSFPEHVGWERVGTFDADRRIDTGWLHQHAELGVWGPEVGETDFYRRSLKDFAGAETFFVEWRVETDVPSSLFDVAGIATAVAASGTSGVRYHFTLTDERVRMIRDNRLPFVFVDIEAHVPHTYRLELNGPDVYMWFIDGELIDSGAPEGPYPTFDSTLIWGARHDIYENNARWDFVRYGTIPDDASGDFDSDDDVDGHDFYFFHECFSNRGPGIDAGPGCRFADIDADNDVDLKDIAAFQNAFGGAN